MFIRCWGSRGSIPVSGKSYLKYGGDTTCLEIRAESGDILIVDAGTGIRRCGNQLNSEGHHRYSLIFTQQFFHSQINVFHLFWIANENWLVASS